MKDGLKKLKQAWDENPIAVITVGTLVLTTAGKFIDAVGSYQSRKAYARDSVRRDRRDRRSRYPRSER